MRLNRLYISLICILFLLLIACNNNENALDPSNETNEGNGNSSSTSTDLTSGDDFSNGKQIKFHESYEYDIVGKDKDEPRQKQTNEQESSQPLSPEQTSDFEAEVIELTNAERSEKGLPALQPNTRLSRVANLKSKEMVTKDYFSHTSPAHGSPFNMMREYGVTYQSAGENIAHGQRTPEQVVNEWMDSEEHRKNILNNKFTHIGVGFVKDGYYWTQMFIEK